MLLFHLLLLLLLLLLFLLLLLLRFTSLLSSLVIVGHCVFIEWIIGRFLKLFMHHLLTLWSLQFGKLHSKLRLTFWAICFKCCLVSFLRVFFFPDFQYLQSLFDSLCYLVVLVLSIWIVQMEYFVVALLFLWWDSLSFFNVSGYFSLSQFLFSKVLLLFIWTNQRITNFLQLSFLLVCKLFQLPLSS